MDVRMPAGAPAAEGWHHLRAFFREGSRHLSVAVAALREAEQAQRRAGDQDGLMVTLLGLSLALRLGRDPAEVQRAVTLAQEVVNLAQRRAGEAVALSYRTHLEAAYKDLADVETGVARVRSANLGIKACDRTVRLARRLRVPSVIPSSQAAKAGLLVLLVPSRAPGEAVRLRRQAARLYAAALAAWPPRDVEGRAAVQIEMAERLAAGSGSGGLGGQAERLLREAAQALHHTDNRYLLALLARAQAREAVAAGRADALDHLEAAVAAFRALGCDREAREVEQLL